MTDDELLWCLTQQDIDAGLHCCSRCAAFGWHTFCGACGTRFLGHTVTWRECPGCHQEVGTDWCTACGTAVYDEALRKWLAGDIDLEAEIAVATKWMTAARKARPELDGESAAAMPSASREPHVMLRDAMLERFGVGHAR